MLTSIGQPLLQDLQDRGYHLLETLEGLRMTQPLNQACRTLFAMLLLRRPSPGAPKVQRDAFKTLCTEVQVWLKDEIAEMRRVQRRPKATPEKVERRRPTWDWRSRRMERGQMYITCASAAVLW